MRCLILEDEKAAQEILDGFIKKTPFLECRGVFSSGLDIPIKLMEEIDVLFLDVELPELNGLSYLKTIDNPPKVIVTSAYSEYAVEAFEENFVDYLVKPFSYERFLKAVARIQSLKLDDEKKHNQFLFVYADKTHHRLLFDDILYLKAEVDYVKLFTDNSSLLILDSLRNWETKLVNHNFFRIHRSYIINMDKISGISGNQAFIDDCVIPIGSSYKKSFIEKLNLESDQNLR